MRFIKINFVKEDKISITYEVKNNQGTFDKISRVAFDEPAPEFTKAMDDLIPFAGELCEFRKEENKKLEVHAVYFSYHGEHDRLGVEMDISRKLTKSSSKLFFTSPVRLEKETESSKKDMSDEMGKAVNKLVAQATKYLEGHIKSTKLDLE